MRVIIHFCIYSRVSIYPQARGYFILVTNCICGRFNIASLNSADYAYTRRDRCD